MAISSTVFKGSISADSLTGTLGSMLYGDSAYDKTAGLTKTVNGVSSMLSTVNDLVSSLKNMAGVRSNELIIGEVTSQEDDSESSWPKILTDSVSAISTQVFGSGVKQQGVIIDGYIDVKSDITVSLPQQPLMYNETIVNHRVRTPNTVVMTIAVSNIQSDNALEGFIQNIDEVVSSATGGLLGSILPNGEDRAMSKLKNLVWLQENGIPFKVYTPVRIYENMLIESIQPVTNIKTYDMLYATITFKEIITYKWWSDNSYANTPNTSTNVKEQAVNQYKDAWNSITDIWS